METAEIDYKKVIDLGFIREDQSDSIFKNQYGFDWFTVTMKLSKNIIAEWDCNKRTAKIVRYDNEMSIKGEIKCKSIDDLLMYLKFYGKYTEPTRVTYTQFA